MSIFGFHRTVSENVVTHYVNGVNGVDDSVNGIFLTLMLHRLVVMKLIICHCLSFGIIVVRILVRARCHRDSINRDNVFNSVLKRLAEVGR